MSRIYVSYRRADEPIVTRIHEHLTEQFGSGSVFRDVLVGLGEHYGDAFMHALEDSEAVVVVIGKNWLRRVDRETDGVHFEIASALAQGKPLIPVLVDNAQMPHEWELPKDIKQLAFLNAQPVRPDSDFLHDIDRLIKALEENTAIRVTQATESHQNAALPLHMRIVTIFGILAATSIGGGIYAIKANATSPTTLDILGAKLSTGNVGVALVGIGFIITFFTVRSVLKNQRDLAALPKDDR